MKRENGRRGDRLSSQIYEEVVRYLKRRPQKMLNLKITSKP
ncbi:hypothetical protein [Microcoleus sp. BROC3]